VLVDAAAIAGDGAGPDVALDLRKMPLRMRCAKIKPARSKGGEAMNDPEAHQAWRLPVSSIVGSFLVGVLFFCVVTPLAFVMRLAGHDPLRLRSDRAMPSYWIARSSASRQISMTRQF
jgi:Saxitoxin biosynthesis operon protein SxtJ